MLTELSTEKSMFDNSCWCVLCWWICLLSGEVAGAMKALVTSKRYSSETASGLGEGVSTCVLLCTQSISTHRILYISVWKNFMAVLTLVKECFSSVRVDCERIYLRVYTKSYNSSVIKSSILHVSQVHKAMKVSSVWTFKRMVGIIR